MIHRLLLWLLDSPGPGRVVSSLVAALLLAVSFAPPGFAQGVPDLVADTIRTRSTVGADAPFKVMMTVRNAGSGDSPATTLRYFRSNRSWIRPSDTELTTVTVEGLAPGGSALHSATVSIPTTGTHYIYACIDGVDGETAMTNNCSDSREIGVGVPVLYLSDISTSTLTPAPGVPFTITARVRNLGTGASPPAPAVKIYYYHAYGNNWIGHISKLDIRLAEGAVDEIASGASAQYSTTVSLSRPGTHWIGVCTGVTYWIADGWTRRGLNRCGGGLLQITVAEPQPDLTVDSVSVADSTVEVGASFTLEATVRNVGSRATDAATTLRYYRSTDATITPTDTAVATDAVVGLAPGGFAPNSATLSITTAGDYWVGACVDTVTEEFTTTNNCSPGVPVTVHPLGSPDLAVDRVRVTGFTEEDDRVSFTITATVQNAGSGASPASALRYYHAADARTTPSGTLVAGDAEVEGLAPAAEVQELAPEATSTHTVTVSLPAAESYWVAACVDTVTGEFRTTNNCSSGVRVTDNDGISALTAIQQLLLLSP